MPSGEVHNLSPPCTVRALWPLPRGILLENADPDGDTAAFVLLQPLDEFMPVTSASARRLGKLLCSVWQRPLLLGFDSVRQAHTLWAVRCDAEWQASASWEQAGGSCTSEAAQSFGSPCGSDGLLLCMLLAEQNTLHIHHLRPSGGATFASSAPVSLAAVAAQPVALSLPTVDHAQADEPQSQMMVSVLHPDGTLLLWLCSQVGARCLHACQATKLPQTPGATGAAAHAALLRTRLDVWRPAGQSVPDRFSMVAAPAPGAPGQEQRLELQLHRRAADPLLALCLRALKQTMPPPLYLDLLASLLGGSDAKGATRGSPLGAHLIFDAAHCTGGGAASTPSWPRFCAQMRSWFGVAPPPGAAAAGAGAGSRGSAWDAMMRGDEHHREASRAACHCLLSTQAHGLPAGPAQPMCAPLTRALQEACLLALHADYEGLKLDCLAWAQLPRLAALLASLASQLDMHEHVTLYARDLGPAVEEHLSPEQKRRIASHLPAARTGGARGGGALPPPPYNVLESLHSTLSGAAALTSSQAAAAATTMLPSAVVELYSLIATAEKGPMPGPPSAPRWPVTPVTPTGNGESRPDQSLAERLVLTMVRRDMGLKHLEVLPLGVAVLLQDAICACRHHAPPNWPTAAYRLIGREDLARQHQEQRRAGYAANAEWPPVVPPAEPGDSVQLADDPDGMQNLVHRSVLRFGRDLRLAEVRRLLCSSRAMTLRIGNGGPELTDHDLIIEQQSRLKMLCARAMALPIGRGMFTLSSAPPQITEALKLAPLTLKGRMPNAATVDLDTEKLPADHLLWPEFHNGVAAALRLAPPGCGRREEGELGRHWIVYNRPGARQHAHAGFLMGLGLQRHLLVLANTDLYRYLSQGHDVTMMAVLLGAAAARRGTMHAAIAKMLCLHIPALHPPTFTELELEVPAVVQTAALLGVGLLYQGSAHRLMTEVLLGEIGRPAANELLECRESYSLTAGLALGMLTLGRGSHAAGLADLRLEDTLGAYMHGKESALPWPAPTARESDRNAMPTRCCRIREGPLVNVDVTAAGATLALGLMFLRTNNASVAAQLRIPLSLHALACVRPDLVLLRVIACNLIMWDEVRPTSEWLDSQLPPLLQRQMRSLGAHTEDEEALRLARLNALAGACTSLGLRFAGSCSKPACELLVAQVKQLHAQRQAGAAGGAAAGAAAGSGTAATKAAQPTIEMCLGATALALAMVMAGSGDLECLRLLRVLRRRVDGDVSYGYHLAISMALGFLFMGGGRLTLGTSKPAIAALLAAIFPRFPLSPADNRYHLQAFRHLYVLAVEARNVEAVDVDSRKSALVPLTVHLKGDDTPPLRLVTPCSLPPLASILSVHVSSPRYWVRELQLATTAGAEGGSGAAGASTPRRVLWVKRKTGHLAYSADPQGLSSIFCRPYDASQQPLVDEHRGAASARAELLRGFCDEPALLAFSRHMCDEQLPSPLAMSSGGAAAPEPGAFELPRFCTAVLFECLTQEKAEMIVTCLVLYRLAMRFPFAQHALPLVSLRLLKAYYAGPVLRAMHAGLTTGPAALALPSARSSIGVSIAPPLQPAFVTSINCMAALSLDSLGFSGRRRAPVPSEDRAAVARAALVSYLSTGLVGSSGAPAQLGALLSSCLAYHNLPLPRRVPALMTAAEGLPYSAEMLPLLSRLRDDPDAPPHTIAALQIAMLGLRG